MLTNKFRIITFPKNHRHWRENNPTHRTVGYAYRCRRFPYGALIVQRPDGILYYDPVSKDEYDS